MVWRYRLIKLARLGFSEFLELLQAQLLLIWAWLRLRLLPRGRLLRGEAGVVAGGHVDVGAAEVEVARRLDLAIARAAEHGLFRPTCLVKSLALERFLRMRGIGAARIQVGVRMREDAGGFGAHAWVELGDLVLGDADWHVRSFTPVRGLYSEGL